MKLGEDGAMFRSIPPNLENYESYAYSRAVDRQMKKLMEFNRCVHVWGNLPELSPKFYDYAAVSLRALYYRSEYTDDVKLQILEQALQIYKFAGTKKAVEFLASTVFSEAKFVPWYEYDGEPYHFKIWFPMGITEEAFLFIRNLIQKVKAARSIFDGIQIKDYLLKIGAYGAVGAVTSPDVIITNHPEQSSEGTINASSKAGVVSYPNAIIK